MMEHHCSSPLAFVCLVGTWAEPHIHYVSTHIFTHQVVLLSNTFISSNFTIFDIIRSSYIDYD